MGADASLLLEVEDLHVRRGAVEVLKGIRLQVRRGEITALVGANGAGKSTVLMTVSGILRPSAGNILFEGEPLHGLPAEQVVARGVTQVPEGRRVFPRLTVLENLRIASARLPGPRAAEELERQLALFPTLRKRQGQLAGTLSGGEQQMLALARGLMARPKLLLLDEPSLGLAPKVVMELFEVIRRIHASGLSILLVEQNCWQALQVAERAYVLETGRVSLEGRAEDLREDPSVKRAYLGG